MQVAWKECTEEDWNYGLEVLPPAWWQGDSFLVGEPYDHRECTVTGRCMATWTGFTKKGEQYLRAEQDVTLPEFTLALRLLEKDADLREAAAGHSCNACGRDSFECSVDPCEAVQRDREAY